MAPTGRSRAAVPVVVRQEKMLPLPPDEASRWRRAVGLPEATVRKHLENAYARLDVTSRTAALAKVLPFTVTG